MLLVLIFLHASQGPCLLSSAPENTRLHARCWERRPHKLEKLFLWFLLAAAARQCGGSTRWCLDKERTPRNALSLTKQIAENHRTAQGGFCLAAFPHKLSNPAKPVAAAAPY